MKGLGFPPLRASGKRSRSPLRLSTVNLNLRASYRHGGKDSLPTDSVVTPPFKTLCLQLFFYGSLFYNPWDGLQCFCKFLNVGEKP
jgi:hypothetical protein